MCLCIWSLSCVQLFGTTWTVSHQTSLSMGILQAGVLEWVVMPSSRGSSQPRDQTQVFHIAGRFLPSEPAGKPTNTGGGSLSLLQGIFLTQESNQVSCIAGGFFTIWAATRKAPSRYNLTKMSDDKYLWSAYCPYPVFPFWETPIRVNPGHVFISLQPHH